MMELLSPAGSRECLVAAVQNGADAVYFGGSMLNARRFADNFEGDGLVSALDYCHERGVKAYITLNTLVFNREIQAAVDFAGELYRYGADAVLVQDLGLASLLRAVLPNLTLHASTQMGIHDIGGLHYCESIGMKRAVLAREVSLDEIRRMHESSPLELEAFGHGALCMSFSGSCLYSSMAGERSGNRGTCAQPCRKNACVGHIPGKDDFCLSPNDICMIEHLDELESAGVCCIKLEGRMKKPEYVAAVTSCYRTALDGASPAELKAMKAKMGRFFSRGDFSTSHMFFDSVRTDRIGSSKPDPAELAEVRNSYKGESRKRPVDMELTLKEGRPAELTMTCASLSAIASGAVVQQAAKPQSEETYRQRLSKLGDTPFRESGIRVSMTESCYISSAELNALRRSCCEALLARFHVRNELGAYEVPVHTALFGRSSAPSPADAATGPLYKYAVCPSCSAALTALESGATAIGVEPFSLSETELKDLAQKCAGKAEPVKLILVLPNVLITSALRDGVRRLIGSGLFFGAEANNIGQLELIKDLPLKIAGIGLNAVNCYTVSELLSKGFDLVVPSQELVSGQLRELCEAFPGRLVLWLHGRVPLMQLLHCPVREHFFCRGCKGSAGEIFDEAGRRFPLYNFSSAGNCLVRMFNCNTTDLVDLASGLPCSAGNRFSFFAEPEQMISERLSAFDSVLRGEAIGPLTGSTRGHYNRKVD